MAKVTVDQLPKKVHDDYAIGQQNLDPLFKVENIPNHRHVCNTKSTFIEATDRLFELERCNKTWATFSPPKNYDQNSDKFFNAEIAPISIDPELVKEQKKLSECATLYSTLNDQLNRANNERKRFGKG